MFDNRSVLLKINMNKPSDPVCDTSSCWTAAALSWPAHQQLFKNDVVAMRKRSNPIP